MIKNYTSRIDYTKSIDGIKKLLVTAGAQSVIEKYGNGDIVGIAFVFPIDNLAMTFQLPARVDDVKKYLIKFKKLETIYVLDQV